MADYALTCPAFVTKIKAVNRRGKESWDSARQGVPAMQSQPRDHQAYVLAHMRKLTAEKARKFHSDPLTTWLLTVVLALIVISMALSLARWPS